MNSQSPHVVWVLPGLVAKARSGGELRTRRLLSALAEQASLDLVVIERNRELSGDLGDALGVRSLNRFSSGTWMQVRATAWRRRWPLGFARAWSPEANRLVRSLHRGGAIVVLEHLWTFPYHPSEGRYILNLQNAEAIRASEFPAPSRLRRRLEWRRDVRLIRRHERAAALDPSCHVIAVSREDATAIGGRVHVVPNGTDVPPVVPPVPVRGPILFVGAMDYPPNVEAAAWWAESVWPLVCGDVPPMTIVGRGIGAMPAHLRSHPAVDVRGEVDDVGPELASASVVVVPLHHGGGTRLKVLEALAWGRPLVTTAKGAEGLPVEHGVHAIVANTPVDFAAGVRRAWHGGTEIAQCAVRGRILAERYAWDSVAASFVDVVLSSDAVL